MFCGDPHLVKHEPNSRSVHRLYCRSWSCDDCAPKRRWGVIKLAEEGKAERLITLTLQTAPDSDPDENARFMADAWAKLLRWLHKRHGGRRVQCLRIFEAHKSGQPHMHILHRGAFVPVEELRAKWKELTGAWNVDIRSIKKKRNVARYVSKYIGKDVHAYKGVKRYYYTRGWVKTRAEKRAERDARGERWFTDKRDPIEIAATWAREGWFVQWLDDMPVAIKGLPP